MSDKLTLREAYDLVLGGTLAISPPLYKLALQEIANMLGRTVDNDFMSEIKQLEKQLGEEYLKEELDYW